LCASWCVSVAGKVKTVFGMVWPMSPPPDSSQLAMQRHDIGPGP
jgi:hypothetical protein